MGSSAPAAKELLSPSVGRRHLRAFPGSVGFKRAILGPLRRTLDPLLLIAAGAMGYGAYLLSQPNLPNGYGRTLGVVAAAAGRIGLIAATVLVVVGVFIAAVLLWGVVKLAWQQFQEVFFGT